MTYENSDPAAIERNLAETRARLNSHLEALSSRLSLGQLLDDGVNYLRAGQGAQFIRNLGADLRDNPLPVAVTGIGLAWLMATGVFPSSRRETSGEGRTAAAFDDIVERAKRAGETLAQAAGETEEAFRTRAAEARGRILGLTREASETAAAFMERVQQALEAAEQSAREQTAAMVDQTRRTVEAVGQAAQQGRDAAARAGAALGETIKQNPLLLGALGLAAGVLLAATLPATAEEEALVAPLGSAIRNASDTAIDRTRQAAEAAAEAAYREMVEPSVEAS